MKKTVLIISDNAHVYKKLQTDLLTADLNVRTSDDLQDGISFFQKIECYLVIIDRETIGDNLPNLLSIVREKLVFSMVLSKFYNSQVRTEAYRYGAVFFLGYPYALEELLAIAAAAANMHNVSKLINTRQQYVPDYSLSGVIFGQNVQINPIRREVIVNRKYVDLSKKEFDLLYYLASNQGKVVSKDEIAENVWHSLDIDDNSITIHIANIRKKIEPIPSRPSFLKTIRGVGYKFIPMQTIA